MNVFITGGTGQIGARLIPALCGRGDRVVLVTRRPTVARGKFGAGCTVVEGDPTWPGPWMDAVAGCDAVVNLAGESVIGRWTEAVKTRMRESRLRTTEHVVHALAGGRAPRVLVSGSGIGYYGAHADETLTEESPPGTDFRARMAVDWEAAALAAQQLGVRVALLRIGAVLDPDAGPLAMMRPWFRLGVAGPIGSGKQVMSWIHHVDMTGLVLFALDNPEARDPLNATAPNPVRNEEFAWSLGRALHRPAFFRKPAFLFRLLLGEGATLMTAGQRVLPARALALGYAFLFPTLDLALADLLAKRPRKAG
jgi:uncharacterized protein (TIGR01777 family)